MRTRWIAALGVSLGAAFGSRAFASQVTYTVDPAQSQLNLSGTYLGQEFVPFSSVNSDGTSVDGLISPFAGTIDADRGCRSWHNSDYRWHDFQHRPRFLLGAPGRRFHICNPR